MDRIISVDNLSLNIRHHISSRIGQLLFVGVLVRIGLWIIFPPIWKVASVFSPLSMPVFKYVADFEGYYPLRMPFFDVFSAVFYAPLSGILGVKGLTLFSVLISCLSLPAFYGGVRQLLDRDVAFYGTVLFALYPKYIVMSVRGMPEAASVAFLSYCLYAYARGKNNASHRMGWYSVAGLAATAAYLMFVPAVFAAIVLSVTIYLDGLNNQNAIVPDWSFWTYNLAPAVVGVLYLVYGPIRTLVSATTGSGWEYYSYNIFVDPTAYSFLEKAVRYVVYTYVDFWWHMRGFDYEINILRRIESFQAFLGDLFPIYALGWFVITAALSVPILYGIYRLASDHELGRVRWTVLGWGIGYFILYNFKNLGWTGAFQTRQLFPIFLAIAIAFGVGLSSTPRISVVNVITRLSQRINSNRLNPSVAAVDLRMVVIAVGLAILLINAGVQGVFTAKNEEIGVENPVKQLNAVHQPGEQVATINQENYRDLLIYSQGTIRPIIWASNESMRDEFEFFTTQAIVKIRRPSELSATDTDYLYVVEQCGEFTPRQRSYIEAANELGEIVLREQVDRGSKCKINIAIIEFRN